MAARTTRRPARKTAPRQKFPASTMADALERSLRNAKHLDASMSATVQAARALARKLDVEQEDAKAAEFLAFIQYCKSLGLTLDSQEQARGEDAAGKPKELTPLEKFMAKRREG